MESYPPPPPPPPLRSQTNGLGIAGFIVSLVGVFTCVLSPVGLILSLVGLRKHPRGFAIAGSIIGGIGTLILGIFAVALLGNPEALGMVKTVFPLSKAQMIIEEHRQANDALPSEEEGNRLIEHLEDGWGNPLRYELDGEYYDIRSAGPDGEFGTDDDFPPEGSLHTR
jgi:hypothetical protein